MISNRDREQSQSSEPKPARAKYFPKVRVELLSIPIPLALALWIKRAEPELRAKRATIFWELEPELLLVLIQLPIPDF